jgi:hypothetical protein
MRLKRFKKTARVRVDPEAVARRIEGKEKVTLQ